MRGKRVVPAEDVLALADGFILSRRAVRYRRSYETPLCLFVRDTTGLLAGRVTDYAIDEATLRVEAIEVMPGYAPSERHARLWMFHYVHRDERPLELTIPACLGQELSEKREGI